MLSASIVRRIDMLDLLPAFVCQAILFHSIRKLLSHLSFFILLFCRVFNTTGLLLLVDVFLVITCLF